jgi:hypothetical protein
LSTLYQGRSIRARRLDDGIAELTFDRESAAINKVDVKTSRS